MKLLYYLSLLQGIFYVFTGVWPLIHLDSFVGVTGPKTDIWLVKTVGVLVLAIGVALISARKNPQLPIVLLAINSALGLAAIDIVYVFDGTISWIYLTDAIIEILLVIAWLSGYLLSMKTVYQ